MDFKKEQYKIVGSDCEAIRFNPNIQIDNPNLRLKTIAYSIL